MSSFTQSIFELLESEFGLRRMRGGKTKNNFGDLNIELRLKPSSSLDGDARRQVLFRIQKRLEKIAALSAIAFHDVSPNSGRYSSVSFILDEMVYDIIVTDGGNRGHQFENGIIKDLIQHVFRGKKIERAERLLTALEASDDTFDRTNIHYVHDRKGDTRRSLLDGVETGKIIADSILEMNDDTFRYLSLKGLRGSTLANFGVGRGIDKKTYAVDETSNIHQILTSLNVNIKKMTLGFQHYDSTKKLDVIDELMHFDVINPHWLFYQAWGLNYFYVRELAKKFQIIKVDAALVMALSSNLTVTEIRYPYHGSKQLEIKLHNDLVSYSIDLRNARGGVEIYPTELKVRITKLMV